MAKTVSSIQSRDGVPCLYINGKAVPGMAYMVYFTENNRYSDFAAAGYRLYSVPVFFGDQTINENTHFPPFSPGIFTEGEPDFSSFDKNIERIIRACPDAYILPRVNVSLPSAWESAHEEELNDKGSAAFPRTRRASFSSDAWAQEVMRLLTLFISHAEEADYCEHIVGYQIAGGLTEEWMAFDSDGSAGRRSREGFDAYCRDTGTERCDTEYYRYLAATTAKRISQFAAHTKALTGGRVVVGAFYGYTLELASRGSTHHALHALLEGTDVDFICSPISYMGCRAGGRDHACMLPIDSLKLWGKLYFSENDTRTHLSLPPNDMPQYNTPLWLGPDKAGSINIIKMHFARALTHSHAMWWFDMWGGWFDDTEYMSLLAEMHTIASDSLSLPAQSRAEVAVFVDENSVFALDSEDVYRRVCYDIREALGLMGAPYDIYLCEDYPRVAEKYKAVISLVPSDTDSSQGLSLYCEQCGKPLLEIRSENSDIGVDALRAFLSTAGVHIYTSRPAVIYASQSYLFLHTADGGALNIVMPHGYRLYEVFKKEYYKGEPLSVAGESYLYKIEKE